MFQIDHVSISGDLASLRLFHYGGRNFEMPYHVIAELTPGKRLDMSAYPKGDLHLLEQVKESRESRFHHLKQTTAI